jgi:hypothetical protein
MGIRYSPKYYVDGDVINVIMLLKEYEDLWAKYDPVENMGISRIDNSVDVKMSELELFQVFQFGTI